MFIGSFLWPLLIVLIILFVIFLIIREVVCWYWKINKIIGLLESIDNKLTHRSTEKLHNEPNITLEPIQKEIFADNREELLKKYGIKYSDISGKYSFEGYDYDKWEDAVNYAKQCNRKR